jgi:cholesterol transport system auxiliary component
MAFPTYPRRLAFLLPVAAVSLMTMALSACGPIVNIGEQTPADVFRLRPLEAKVAEAPKPGWRLLIDEPSASGGLGSNRIAVFTGPLELKFLADARWSQRLPAMMQAMLIDSFETGAGAMAMTVDAPAAAAPFVLAADIRDFQADVSQRAAPTVTVRIAFTLSTRAPAEVLGYKVITATAEATGDSGSALAEAFNRASRDVLTEVVTWTAQSVAAAP